MSAGETRRVAPVDDPLRRLEVSNLVLLAALCQRRDPQAVTAEIVARAAPRSRLATEAVNERFRVVHARRDRSDVRR